MIDQNLKYPIGKFVKPEAITQEMLTKWINIIETFPAKLNEEVISLTDTELKYKYRNGGWNIKQIVHHCADSHINSFIRFKLTLTEDNPTIKPYLEARWAELPDVCEAPINNSLDILSGLHFRWTLLLKNLDEDDLSREFYHPESNNLYSLRENIGIYAWHCIHHLEHIKLAKQNKF